MLEQACRCRHPVDHFGVHIDPLPHSHTHRRRERLHGGAGGRHLVGTVAAIDQRPGAGVTRVARRATERPFTLAVKFYGIRHNMCCCTSWPRLRRRARKRGSWSAGRGGPFSTLPHLAIPTPRNCASGPKNTYYCISLRQIFRYQISIPNLHQIQTKFTDIPLIVKKNTIAHSMYERTSDALDSCRSHRRLKLCHPR